MVPRILALNLPRSACCRYRRQHQQLTDVAANIYSSLTAEDEEIGQTLSKLYELYSIWVLRIVFDALQLQVEGIYEFLASTDPRYHIYLIHRTPLSFC